MKNPLGILRLMVKKLCIKLEWKIQNSDPHNITYKTSILNASSTPFSPVSPNNLVDLSNTQTPINPYASKFQPDSGYHSQSDVYSTTPKYTNRSRDVNKHFNRNNSPLPRTKLFSDLYRPKSYKAPDIGHTTVKSEHIVKLPEPSIIDQDHANQASEILTVILPDETDSKTLVDSISDQSIHDTTIDSENNDMNSLLLSQSTSNLPDSSTPPDQQITPPNNRTSNDSSASNIEHHLPQPVIPPEAHIPNTLPYPPVDVILPTNTDSSTSKLPLPKSVVPPNPPNPSTPNTLPGRPSPVSSKSKKNKKKNKKIRFEAQTSTQSPKINPPEPLTNLPSSPSTDSNSVKIIPNPRTLVISDCSSDGCIKTEIDPTVPEYDPQNEEFAAPPDVLPLDSDGCLDSNLRVDRMCIPGKCRLCNKHVDSYNVDLHLLDCHRIEQFDIDDFAHEYADITQNSYHDIINVVYDYCQCIMHDDEISIPFRKLSIFRKFLHELNCILDRKAIRVFQKNQLFGQRNRFNILNYSQNL